MLIKKESAVARKMAPRDPFAMVRDLSSELDRMFDAWPALRWPALGAKTFEGGMFIPAIEVFEKDHRLVTRVDLPGLKKEDVKVEVIDGHLIISGERKNDIEEKKDDFYRSERLYGSFYRAVALPDGVKLEDIKGLFSEGVLEVSVPLPVKPKQEVRNVEILEPEKPTKAA